ncbi:MAG: thermonuclease family protein [Mesorhizobium sp.]
MGFTNVMISIVPRTGLAVAFALLSAPCFAHQHRAPLWDGDKPLYSVTAIAVIGALLAFMIWIERGTRPWPQRRSSQSTLNRYSGLIALALFMLSALAWTSNGFNGDSVGQLVSMTSGSHPTVIRSRDARGSNVVRLKDTHADRAAMPPPVVIDGDTISIDGEKVRILSIDAPESFNSRCERELALGLEAKRRLRELLKGRIELLRNGKDRYGRTLARVFADGRDVGQTLLQEGFVLSYRPGGSAKEARLKKWCGPNARLDDSWSG